MSSHAEPYPENDQITPLLAPDWSSSSLLGSMITLLSSSLLLFFFFLAVIAAKNLREFGPYSFVMQSIASFVRVVFDGGLVGVLIDGLLDVLLFSSLLMGLDCNV